MKNNIKFLLEKTDLTATEIIAKAKISRATFYEVMNEERIPKLDTAKKISDAFGCSLVEVFPELKEVIV